MSTAVFCPSCKDDVTEHVDELMLEIEGEGAYGDLVCPVCRADLQVEFFNGVTTVTVK